MLGHTTNMVSTVDRPFVLPVWLLVQLPEQLVLPVPVSGWSVWLGEGERVVDGECGWCEVVRAGRWEKWRVRGSGVQGYPSQAHLHVYTSLAAMWLPYKLIRDSMFLQQTLLSSR